MRRNRIRDGCAVDTGPLADMLKDFRDGWTRQRPPTSGRFRREGIPAELSPIGAVEWLSAETGLPVPKIESIVSRRERLTELCIADALVTALDRPEAFHDGTLNVVENPHASKKARKECCGGSARPESLTG